MIRSFHSISKKYLPLYLAEFEPRWNTREDTDGERMDASIKKTKGKRFTLKQLTTRLKPLKTQYLVCRASLDTQLVDDD